MAYKKPKPLLRNGYDITMRAAVADFVQKYVTSLYDHPFKSCLNCTYWDAGKDLCKKFNAKPPTDIIVYSCPDHEDDEGIPF